jgi:hypothetical protein
MHEELFASARSDYLNCLAVIVVKDLALASLERFHSLSSGPSLATFIPEAGWAPRQIAARVQQSTGLPFFLLVRTAMNLCAR